MIHNLYRLTWTMPGEDHAHTAVMNHAATMSLASALGRTD